MRSNRFGSLILALVGISFFFNPPRLAAAPDTKPIQIGTRLELMIDGYLSKNSRMPDWSLHQPYPAGIVMRFDSPWEGSFTGYHTILKDGERFRMYYRGLPADRADGSDAETTCYAESTDGITWFKPKLGLFEVYRTKDNNVVLAKSGAVLAQLLAVYRQPSGVPAAERFKALAGTVSTGLFVFVSADGLRWRKFFEKPSSKMVRSTRRTSASGPKTSNVTSSITATWSKGGFGGFRSVSRATSADLLSWGSGVEMQFGSTPREHLYTARRTPISARPIYTSPPHALLPGKKVLTDKEAAALGVKKGYAGDCADAVLMTSRGETNTRARSWKD